MYGTCLFCTKAFDRNEVIEHFPVGRRLAFDAAKGRLWVICRRCERWNLTPIEERWEAIEDCERCFRDTRIRVSTDNIGLAQLREGLELVRIGEALRPEFAAWRYGDQFGRRQRRTMILAGASVAALGAVVAGATAAGISTAVFAANWTNLFALYTRNRVVGRVVTEDGTHARVRFKHLDRTWLIPHDGEDGWGLQVHHEEGLDIIHGPEAIATTSRLMAFVNRGGATKKAVQTAVSRIEAAGDPAGYFLAATKESYSTRRYKAGYDPKKLNKTGAGSLTHLPVDARLALEMATQEEAERRAVDEDLEILEAAWRAAEEIAEISDNLLVPVSSAQFIDRHRSPRDP